MDLLRLTFIKPSTRSFDGNTWLRGILFNLLYWNHLKTKKLQSSVNPLGSAKLFQSQTRVDGKEKNLLESFLVNYLDWANICKMFESFMAVNRRNFHQIWGTEIVHPLDVWYLGERLQKIVHLAFSILRTCFCLCLDIEKEFQMCTRVSCGGGVAGSGPVDRWSGK